jgi:1-deoxy-D-xylulose-5-phosphate reductoisomerase
VLNASNEVAVDLFLSQRIRFDQIHDVNLTVLSLPPPAKPKNLEDLLNIDIETRILAIENAKKLPSFK